MCFGVSTFSRLRLSESASMLSCLLLCWIPNLLRSLFCSPPGSWLRFTRVLPVLSEGLTCSIMRDTIAIRLKILSIALVLVPGLSITALGQSLPAAGAAFVQDGDSGAASGDVTCALETTSRLGSLTYVPEQWGEFLLRMQNSGNAPRELLCTSYFDGQSTLQYGRKVWLPPQSRITLPHPVLFPAADQFDDGRALVKSLLIDRGSAGGKEVLIETRAGQLQRDRTFLVASTDRHTGVVAGWRTEDTVPQDVLDIVAANRVYQGLDNRVTYLDGQFLPADESSLKYLDHLVLAEDRLVDDLAALSAVRRWLHSGGRLWIMLDRTGPELLERLFGDEFQGCVVDQVGLTSVRVDKPASMQAPEGTTGEVIEYDEPVQMSRLAGADMKVWNTVNGWPAALTRTYGEGRVLITTLGPRGWIKPTPPPPPSDDDDEEEKKTPPTMMSDFVPRSPMEDIAPFILARREPEPLPPASLEPFAQEFISYNVPTGTLIIGTMGGFLALLALTGSGLWRWGRLEHFGWCGSLLAIVFGGVFLGIGLNNRHGTSETIASVQLAQAIGGTDDVRTHGAIAVYRPEGADSVIQTTHGGEMLPDLSGSEGSASRMVTTDLGAFQWEGLAQPPGMGIYPVSTSGAQTDRLEARATVNAEGIVGRCASQAAGGTNAIIATRRGRVSVVMGTDGSFTAPVEGVMEPDQYLNATLLDDTQDRRRRILQALFSDDAWRNSLDTPQLMLWVNGWEHGFEFGDGLERRGDTMLSAPLALTRPEAGTEVLIPSPLIDYTSRRPPDGSIDAGFWDDGRQEWQERSSRSTSWLNVHVPQAFLPLEARQLSVEITVSGLMGQIELLGVKDGSAVSLQSVDDPVGTVVMEIDDPDVLAVSESGELTLGLSAGVLEDADGSQAGGGAPGGSFNADTPSVNWRIESLAVQLRAVTAATAETTTELAEETDE